MSRSKRKLDHIEHALETGQSRASGLDDIQFIHQSFPDLQVNEVSLMTEIGELTFSSPVFINAMTGGGGRATEDINRQLAQIANVFNIPMAVGSQMAAVKNRDEQHSYKVVRQYHPKGVVFANVGSEASLDQAKYCVDILEADGLQIHMNVVQELVMPEGDRDFSGALSRIENIVKHIKVPVIIKEVGFGLSREAVTSLENIGVNYVDVGGYGGTNFSRIENERRDRKMSYFNDWGIPTAVSIAEASSAGGRISIFASGGIQHALDIAKAISLGAGAAGMAGQVLKWIQREGFDKTVTEMNHLHEDLKMIMAALGAKSIPELQRAPLIIKGKAHHWLNERGIQTSSYARRRL